MIYYFDFCALLKNIENTTKTNDKITLFESFLTDHKATNEELLIIKKLFKNVRP
jgi:hypothetical protein